MMIASESIEVDSASEVVSLTVWNLGARAATREHTTRAAHLYTFTVPVLYPICDPRSKTQCPLVPVKSRSRI